MNKLINYPLLMHGYASYLSQYLQLTIEHESIFYKEVLSQQDMLIGCLKVMLDTPGIQAPFEIKFHLFSTDCYFELVRKTKDIIFNIKSEIDYPDLVISFDSIDLPSILPAPKEEVFVYSPTHGVEGVHLKYHNIARGGIRRSEERHYRAEALKLAHTQALKNAVIVPGGAKGCYISKHNISEENAYKIFLTGLLEQKLLLYHKLHQNHNYPLHTVQELREQLFFFVAADKGTAQFSALANSIARAKNYWLTENIIASGSTIEYNHKAIGITSIGVLESLKCHMSQLKLDLKNPFTMIGIGDMSGDVFGNTILLCRQVRLVGAFDRDTIYLNPDPDEAENQYLHHLFQKGLSWKFHKNKALLIDRNLDVVSLSQFHRDFLKLTPDDVSPDDIIIHMLRLPVTVIFNGGIGTYISGIQESNPNRASVTADQIQAQIIIEGGNLGVTHQGRIELARKNIKINSDFFDNSLAVRLSDYEVQHRIHLQLHSIDADIMNQIMASIRDTLVQKCKHDMARDLRNIELFENLGRDYVADFLKKLMDIYHHVLLQDFKNTFSYAIVSLVSSIDESEYLRRPNLVTIYAFVLAILKDIYLYSLKKEPRLEPANSFSMRLMLDIEKAKNKIEPYFIPINYSSFVSPSPQDEINVFYYEQLITQKNFIDARQMSYMLLDMILIAQ